MNKILNKKKEKEVLIMIEANENVIEDVKEVVEDGLTAEETTIATEEAPVIVIDEVVNQEINDATEETEESEEEETEDDSDSNDSSDEEEAPRVYVDPSGEGRTLAEVIADERLEKVNAQPRSVKQLAKNPKLLNYNLVIQRKLKWTDHQNDEFIESFILGYPVPPVYTLKSDNKQLQLLEGKQRMNSATSFYNNEWALGELPDAFGVKLTGKYFRDLPIEFQDLIGDFNIVFYQYEKLEDYQRDQIFRRINSGTPLTAIEIIRAILGSEHLQYVMDITKNEFFQYVQMTPNQMKNFTDEELVLQLIGLLTGKTKDAQRETMTSLAIKLRDYGLTDDEKKSIADTFEYLKEVFAEIDPKIRKSILKKNDIVAIVNAVDLKMDAKSTGEKIATYLKKNQTTEYKLTKSSSGAKQGAVEKRIAILKDVISAKLVAVN